MERNTMSARAGLRVFIPETCERGMITEVRENNVKVLISHGMNQRVTLIPGSMVEVACDEVYQVGDKVESTFGSFTGVVTGYELETNRVVCSSDKEVKSSRIRYSYELKHLNPVETVKFFAGDCFTVATSDRIMDCVVVYPQENHNQKNIYLVSLGDHQIKFKLPKLSTKQDFQTNNIKSIERI
jgi:hypothetical protein